MCVRVTHKRIPAGGVKWSKEPDWSTHLRQDCRCSHILKCRFEPLICFRSASCIDSRSLHLSRTTTKLEITHANLTALFASDPSPWPPQRRKEHTLVLMRYVYTPSAVSCAIPRTSETPGAAQNLRLQPLSNIAVYDPCRLEGSLEREHLEK